MDLYRQERERESWVTHYVNGPQNSTHGRSFTVQQLNRIAAELGKPPVVPQTKPVPRILVHPDVHEVWRKRGPKKQAKKQPKKLVAKKSATSRKG